MEQLSNIKSLFRSNVSSNSLEPEIGFKLTFSKSSKQLKVKVISARHLPVNYGNVKPRGYSVKVSALRPILLINQIITK